jgi:hypothetical protein
MFKVRSKIDGLVYTVVCTNELTFDVIGEEDSIEDYDPVNCKYINHSDCEEVVCKL